MRDYRDLRRVYNLTLTQAFFALLEQKVLDVWEQLAKLGYNAKDWFDFTDDRWKALLVEQQIQYSSGYQKWYAERFGQPLEKSFDGSLFRLIPPGQFMMGSPRKEAFRHRDEDYRKVYIGRPLWVGRYPVTQIEYEQVLEENPSLFRGANRPVEQVSWHNAKMYCAQSEFGTLLLNEKEWEYACRAGTTTAYSFGNDPVLLEEYGWYLRNSGYETHPVGEKRGNAWGLQDMCSHVFEWNEDIFDTLNYAGLRVTRGNNWGEGAVFSRSAFRDRYLPTTINSGIGFRVCKAI